MTAAIVLLILGVSLALWGYFQRGIIILFASFFSIAINIPLTSVGSELSTMAIRFAIFGFFVLLQAQNRSIFKHAFAGLFKSHLFLGFLALLFMGLLSARYSGTNLEEKMMLLRNIMIYTLIPMALIIAFYGNLSEITYFPFHFCLLTIITIVVVYRFLDTSSLVIDDRATIQTMGFNSIFLSRMGVICLISAMLFFYNDSGMVKRLISATAGVISIFFVLLSSQRASVIGFIVALLVWLQFGVKIQRNLRPMLILLVLASGTLSLNIERFALLGRFRDLENYQSYERYYDYGKSLSLFMEKPVFGNGLMGYEEKTGRMYPHNIFLEIIVEYGMFGLIIYLYMLAEIFQVIFRIFQRPNANFGMQAIALSWIALFIANFFAGTMRGSSDYFALSGILSAMKCNSILPMDKKQVKGHQVSIQDRPVQNA